MRSFLNPMFTVLLLLVICCQLVEGNLLDHSHEKHEKYKQELKIKLKKDELDISSKSKTEDSKLDFGMFMKQKGHTFEVSMKLKAEENDTKIQEEIRMTFENVIEYIDKNGDLIYDDDDSIVQEYGLGKKEWNNVKEITDGEDPEGMRVYESSTKDGMFIVTARFVEEEVTVGDVMISPWEFKFDIEINFEDFYEKDNSQLALGGKLKTKNKSKKKNKDGHVDGVESDDGVFYLDWYTHILADGVERNVSTSDLKSENGNQKIIWSFQADHPNKIFWDPKVGTNTGSSGDAFFTSACSRLCTLVIVGALYLLF